MPWRAAAVGLAVVLVLAATVIGPLVDRPATYLVALTGIGLIPVVAAQLASGVAARRCHPADRSFWRLWLAANVALGVTGLLFLAASPEIGAGRTAIAPIGVALSGTIFLLAHADAMRRRSGDLSLGIDVVQGLIATFLVGAVVLTALGNHLVDTSSSWYTLPTAMTFTGTVIGLVWSAQLFQRAPRATRRVEGIVVALGLISVLNALGQLSMAVADFTLPVIPLLALHGLTMSVLLLVPLHASRRRAAGLERLAPHDQVRSSRALTIFVLIAIPTIAIEVVTVHDEVTWAVANFAFVMAVVAVLAAIRSLLVLRETTHLYEAVAAASAERQHLLVALLRSMDDDRHRFASQLHRQATASYATFATLARSATRATPVAGDLAETTAELRAELGRNADALRDLVRAVMPIEHEAGSARSLTTSIRAFVDSLYGNGAAPMLVLDVADDLHLDWATEAVVARILQEAIANVWRHADAATLTVEVAAADGDVVVVVVDDGRGFDPAVAVAGGGLDAIRTFVDLGHGHIDVASAPGAGATVRARLGPLGVTDRPAPVRLRPVIDLTDDDSP